MTDAIPPVIAKTLGPGAVIAGRYRLQARLGTGGGGTVWRCLDEQLQAVVALKIVGDGGDLERWRREVAMARRIANRNVCRVHDLGETAELRYVTMELVEGVSLRARMASALPGALARDLFTQVVAGAAAIHAAGVVHRDLKPENIVVAHDGRAVIVDFGLAREPRGAGATTTGRPGGHRCRHGGRHAALHVARAGGRSARRCAHRCVGARADRPRADDRCAARTRRARPAHRARGRRDVARRRRCAAPLPGVPARGAVRRCLPARACTRCDRPPRGRAAAGSCAARWRPRWPLPR